jgi:lysozyme
MDYKTASETRKKSFGDIFAQKMADGGGIGSSFKGTFSEKIKSNLIGIKETFDPQNIAKAVGGKVGASIYGRVMGRSAEDTAHIAGVKIKDKKLNGDGELNSSSSSASDALGLIYRLLMRAYDEESERRNSNLEEQKKENAEENSRNQLLIEAFKVKKDKSRGEKKADRRKERKSEKKKEKEEKKPTEPVAPTPTEKGKPSKTTAKPTEEKPTTTPVKPVEEKPTTTPVKPTETKTVKKPTTEKINVPPISGGDKGVMSMIKKHEGVRLEPYQDSLGLWTVGVGHLIGDGKSLPAEWKGKKLTMQEVDDLFAKDFVHHKEMAKNVPGWDLANETGKAALIDLTFNMGGAWYKKFPNAAKALAVGDFNKAADELTDSLWYKQVKDRAKTIVGMIRSGGDKTNEIGKPKTVPSSASAGSEIDQASKTNKELKKDMENTESQNIVNNNITVNKTSKTNKSSPPEDDRNVYTKKSQGQ